MGKDIKKILVKNEHGKISLFSCECCLKVEFKNLMWIFKFDKYQGLKKYLENLSSGELDFISKEDERYAIGTSNSCMYAYFNEEEIDLLIELMEKGEIEFHRQKLLANVFS